MLTAIQFPVQVTEDMSSQSIILKHLAEFFRPGQVVHGNIYNTELTLKKSTEKIYEVSFSEKSRFHTMSVFGQPDVSIPFPKKIRISGLSSDDKRKGTYHMNDVMLNINKDEVVITPTGNSDFTPG